MSKESTGGGLTVAGDEEGRLRPQPPNLEFTSLPSKQPEIERWLSTTEVRGRSRSRERREGAAGVPPSPRSSELNNGGRGNVGVWGLYEHGGCKLELRECVKEAKEGIRGLK